MRRRLLRHRRFDGDLPDAFGAFVQYPGASGRVWDPRAVIEVVHAAGGLAVVAHGYVRFTADVDLILDLEPPTGSVTIPGAGAASDRRAASPVAAVPLGEGVGLQAQALAQLAHRAVVALPQHHHRQVLRIGEAQAVQQRLVEPVEGVVRGIDGEAQEVVEPELGRHDSDDLVAGRHRAVQADVSPRDGRRAQHEDARQPDPQATMKPHIRHAHKLRAAFRPVTRMWRTEGQ